MIRLSICAVFSACLSCFAGALPAQPYPSKPIRLVVPYAPGGGTDVFARLLSQKLSEILKYQVVVENRPGANGIIGSEIVAMAPPDGYTLLITTNALTVNPSLYQKVPYDTLKAFAPVTIGATTYNLLAVHPSLPVKTVEDLIRLAKARPGQLNFASGGAGQPSHLAGELFRLMAGIDIVHIPYKGTGASIADLLSGNVPLTFSSIPSLLPYVTSGKLRPLGVTGAKRVPVVPDVPPIAETLPKFEMSLWYGILAPAGTSKEIVHKLHSTIVKALALPEIKDRLSNLAYEPGGETPEEFGAVIKRDLVQWARVVKEAGIRMQ